jgi:hypothetical protein
MPNVRRLVRSLEYTLLFLQLPANERQWSIERMARQIQAGRARRFWWVALKAWPLIIGLALVPVIIIGEG